MYELSIRIARRKAYGKGEITRSCSLGSSDVWTRPPANKLWWAMTAHPHTAAWTNQPLPVLAATGRPELAGSVHEKSHNHFLIPLSISSDHDPPSSCALMLFPLCTPLGLSYEPAGGKPDLFYTIRQNKGELQSVADGEGNRTRFWVSALYQSCNREVLSPS
jgi:hypothetical protein